jgi:hypothetical protein
MKIPNGQPANPTEVEEKDVSRERERENESRRLRELMMRLQTMMSLSEPEENDWPTGREYGQRLGVLPFTRQ